MRGAALLLAALLSACGVPEHSPMMKPGEDCLSCHGSGAGMRWYAAGTVYADAEAATGEGIQGAVVVITDSNNRRITLKTNGAGNFYTAETLTFPASVEVQRNGNSLSMPYSAPEGACNHCHDGSRTGRIFAP